MTDTGPRVSNIGDISEVHYTLAIARISMPTPKAYLDTCIVSGLAKCDIAEAEVSALLRILDARTAGRVELLTSAVVNAEISRIPAPHRTAHAAIYKLLADVPTAPTHLTNPRLVNANIFQSAWRE